MFASLSLILRVNVRAASNSFLISTRIIFLIYTEKSFRFVLIVCILLVYFSSFAEKSKNGLGTKLGVRIANLN